MPPRKRKAKAKAEALHEQGLTFSPQAVPDTLQLPEDGPDRFNKLTPELRLRVYSFLHASGEARWEDKSDLKALHLTSANWRDYVEEEFFRYVRLNINCEATNNDPILIQLKTMLLALLFRHQCRDTPP